jgi:hypothetical protein
LKGRALGWARVLLHLCVACVLRLITTQCVLRIFANREQHNWCTTVMDEIEIDDSQPHTHREYLESLNQPLFTFTGVRYYFYVPSLPSHQHTYAAHAIHTLHYNYHTQHHSTRHLTCKHAYQHAHTSISPMLSLCKSSS